MDKPDFLIAALAMLRCPGFSHRQSRQSAEKPSIQTRMKQQVMLQYKPSIQAIPQLAAEVIWEEAKVHAEEQKACSEVKVGESQGPQFASEVCETLVWLEAHQEEEGRPKEKAGQIQDPEFANEVCETCC